MLINDLMAFMLANNEMAWFLLDRKSSLSLLKKMIHYTGSPLLCEMCDPELGVVNFAGSLTEVLTNVLDHEVMSLYIVNVHVHYLLCSLSV